MLGIIDFMVTKNRTLFHQDYTRFELHYFDLMIFAEIVLDFIS